MQKDNISVIQNETELERRIYNGTFSAGLFIEDVQAGDIIEFSFTIAGENPVLDGYAFNSLLLQYWSPVRKLYTSVVYQNDIDFNYKLLNTNHAPRYQVNGEKTTLVWETINAEELLVYDDLPPWYDPFPQVQISSFSTWTQLISWAAALYKAPDITNQKLIDEIDHFLNSAKNKEEEINRIIHFVQDDIRYVGIEVNEHSLKPHHPHEVYSKRYGDCKDKSLLLVSMLKRIGIESYVALVSTDYRHKIVEYLPSPYVFNHAIVAIQYNDELYYVDPTISGQGGSFTHCYNGNYKKGLILDERYSEPQNIPLKSEEKIIINESYTVTDSAAPVNFMVNTTY